MCGTCTTVIDAATTNGVLIAAWATNRFRSHRARRAGASATDHAVEVWEEHADFVSSLGLDPWMTLGAPPAPPVSEPRRVFAAVPAADRRPNVGV